MQNISIYPGAILELQSILRHKNPKKIFLVTGKESYIKCGASEKLSWLNKFYDVIHFFEFESNPSSIDVEQGVKIFNKEKCDLIISVGGGSPIDMAKLINYFHGHDNESLDRDNLKNAEFKPIPHICIPTTAGSGSESTHFAVMYIGNEKFSIAHENLVPEIAIIDPELHYSQTPYQKAVSGADALAQAIESLWSIKSTIESRSYSEKALELVWHNLPSAVHQGDKLAHLNLAVGANLAGRAINIAKTTAPHALAYSFTKFYNIPHGHAVSLTLPYFLEFNLNDYLSESNYLTILRNFYQGESPKKIREILFKYYDNLGLEPNFAKISKAKKVDKNLILDSVNLERLHNNPISISNEDIRGVLDELFIHCLE